MQSHDAFGDLQWFGPRTRGSNMGDILFAVLLPVACFAFQPDFLWGALIPPLALYGIAGGVALAMIAWVTCGGRWPRFDAVLAGMLFVGFLVSISAAVLLLPYAILGILLSIASIGSGPPGPIFGLMGILGLVPFGTAFVCFRAATRILGAQTPWPRGLRAAAGAALLCGIAFAYQEGADRLLDRAAFEIAHGQDPGRAIRTLELWRPVVPRREFVRRGMDKAFHCDPLADSYAVAYRRVTGVSIEDARKYLD